VGVYACVCMYTCVTGQVHQWLGLSCGRLTPSVTQNTPAEDSFGRTLHAPTCPNVDSSAEPVLLPLYIIVLTALRGDRLEIPLTGV
jgi:hypothetical protein